MLSDRPGKIESRDPGSSTDLVSIVVSVYNQQTYIAETVDSLLAQIYPQVEVVVIDDGSTDDTSAILLRYGSKIRYERIENSGMDAARNLGAQIASGQWISFCDGDDIYLPDKVEKQMKLACAAGVDYVTCDYVHFSDSGAWSRSHFSFAPPGFWGSANFQCELGFVASSSAVGGLVTFQPNGVSSPLMRKSFFEAVGRWNEDLSGVLAEDTDFHFRCCLHGRIGVVPEVLWHYRRHDRQRTADELLKLIGNAEMWERILRTYPEAQANRDRVAAGIQTLRHEIVLDALHRRRFVIARAQARLLNHIPLDLRCKLAATYVPVAYEALAGLRRRVSSKASQPSSEIVATVRNARPGAARSASH